MVSAGSDLLADRREHARRRKWRDGIGVDPCHVNVAEQSSGVRTVRADSPTT
eukprot:COSAG06_NODE_18718_length_872_cov_0.783959_1_plen_51_part_10